jgi:hypothetical protein
MGPATKQHRSIDVTGLSDEAVRAVEHLVSQLLQQQRGIGSPVSSADWKKKFDAWMREAQARAGRYPSSFVVDDSRETIHGDDRDA